MHNSLKYMVRIVVGIFLATVLTCISLYVSALMDSRFSLKEMDLNNDGIVSFTEADYVTNSGVKEVEVNGIKCIEYFAYKDGLTLKSVCNEGGL